MTKPSPILVAPVMALRELPPAEREVVSRFLFGRIRGLDRQHDTRWRQLWKRLWRAEAGEVLQLDNVVDRSGPFHRMHMAMEQAVFDAQERFEQFQGFRLWLKTGAGWGTFEREGKTLVFVPSSTAYDQCSDDEMRELHTQMLEFLHTDRALTYLWPTLKPAKRAQMLADALSQSLEDEAP